MNTRKMDAVKWLKRAVGTGCLVYIAAFLVLAVQQIRYPYELEWMEGGMADSVARVIEGQPLYTEPTLDFTPYTYTPLYFHFSAWMARLTGPGLPALRLTAFLGTLGCFALLFLFGWRETRSPFYGLLSCGLFAALFRAGGAWYAIARADTWCFFFILAGILLLRVGQRRTLYPLLAGLSFCLAFFCKQTALFVALPMSCYALFCLKGWRRVLFPLVIALVIPLSTVLFSRLTDGWYSFYIFELPSGHHLVLFRVISFWLMDLFHPLFIAILFGGIYAARLLCARRWNDFWFLFFTAGGLIAAAWLVRVRAGSFANTVLPAYVGISLFFGLAVKQAIDAAGAIGEPNSDAAPSEKPLLPVVILLACLAQLLTLFYDPTVQLPTADDRAAGDHLIRLIQRFPGDVLIPAHGYLAPLAGKPAHAQHVAYYDIERGSRTQLIAAVTNELNQALLSGRFDAIILDFPWHTDALLESYEYRGDVFDNDVVFWPVTGRRVRPKSVYVRKGLEVDLSDMIPSPRQ